MCVPEAIPFMSPRQLVPVLLVALGLVGCNRRPSSDGVAALAASATSAPAPSPPRHVRAIGQLGPGRGTLVLSLEPPKHGKLTAGGPLSVEGRGEHLGFPLRINGKLDPAKLPLRIPIDVADGATGPAHLKLSYYWCETGEGSSCRPERADLVVDLDTSGDAEGGEAHLSYLAAGS